MSPQHSPYLLALLLLVLAELCWFSLQGDAARLPGWLWPPGSVLVIPCLVPCACFWMSLLSSLLRALSLFTQHPGWGGHCALCPVSSCPRCALPCRLPADCHSPPGPLVCTPVNSLVLTDSHAFLTMKNAPHGDTRCFHSAAPLFCWVFWHCWGNYVLFR